MHFNDLFLVKVFLVSALVLWVARVDVYISKYFIPGFSAFLPVITALFLSFMVFYSKDRVYVKKEILLIFILMFLFSFSVMLGLAFHSDYENFLEYLSYLVFSINLALVFLVALSWPKLFYYVALIGGALLSGSVILDVVGVYDFNKDGLLGGGRGAGFADNPNYAVIGLAVCYFILRDISGSERDTFLKNLFVLCIFLTGSRYGALLALLVLVFDIFMKVDLKKKIYTLVVGILFSAFVIGYILPTLKESSSLYRRLTLSDEVMVLKEDSRFRVVFDYFGYINEEPLGRGLAFSKSVKERAHNTFLNYMADFGVHVGLMFLVLYISIVLLTLRSARQSGWIKILFLVSVPFFNNNVFVLKSLLIFISFCLFKYQKRKV